MYDNLAHSEQIPWFPLSQMKPAVRDERVNYLVDQIQVTINQSTRGVEPVLAGVAGEQRWSASDRNKLNKVNSGVLLTFSIR